MSRLSFALAELLDSSVPIDQRTVKVIGYLDQSTSLSITKSLDGSHSVSVTMSGYNSIMKKAVPLLTDIVVFIDGEPDTRFRLGPRKVTKDNDTGAQTVTFTCWSYKELLADRYILPGDALVYDGIDIEEAAWNLINLTQQRPGAGGAGDLGIVRAGDFTGVPVTWSGQVGTKISEAIDQIVATGASVPSGDTTSEIPSWDIDVLGVFGIAYPMLGNLSPTFTAAYGTNVYNYEEDFDPSTYVNFAQVVGGTPPSPQPALQTQAGVYASDLGEDGLQLFEGYFSEPSLLTDAAVAAKQAWYLQKLGVVRPTYTLYIRPSMWSLDKLALGDYLNVIIEDGCLDVRRSDLRCTQIQLTEDDTGKLTVVVTAGFRMPGVIDKVSLVYSQVGIISAGVPGPSVTVSSVSASIAHGASADVTIVGAGFASTPSVTSVDGIAFTNVEWESGSAIGATVTVDSAVVPGVYNVSVNNPVAGAGTGIGILTVT